MRRAVLTIFLDGYRRTARWTAVRHLLARDDDTADHGPASSTRLDVQTALLTLRPRLRACVVLRFYDDLTVPEIARRLDVADGTVKRYLFDAITAARVPAGPDARRAHRRHPAGHDRSHPMSPDLARALHDAVDTGPDDAPFDVTWLTARIRRRRPCARGSAAGWPSEPPERSRSAPCTSGADSRVAVLPAARADAGAGDVRVGHRARPDGRPRPRVATAARST